MNGDIKIGKLLCDEDIITVTPILSGGSGDYSYVWPDDPTPCDCESFDFEFELDDGDSQWEISFSIEIHAPVFEIANPELVDENMDGIWDPGEEATINLDLINFVLSLKSPLTPIEFSSSSKNLVPIAKPRS